MDSGVVRFFDHDLNFLGEADDFTAAIYITKWNTYGEFELYFPVRREYMAKDNFIVWSYDTRKNGIIKYISCSEEGVTLKGYSLLWLLTNRITIPPTGKEHDSLSGTVEDVMIGLVDHNAVNPADPDRKIPLLKCRESQKKGGSYKYQTRYANLQEDLTAISQVTKLGIDVDMDLENKALVFEVLEGTDRSAQQQERSPVVFATYYDNVGNREYVLNDMASKNCAYVAGQGEGVARRIAVVGDGYTGMDRKEIFIDARDLENDADLPERGRTKLANMQTAENYSTEVDASGYESQWFLGDYVTIIDEEFGVSLMVQALSVEEAMDDTGYTITPTFGIPEKEIGSISSSDGEISGGGGDITYIHTQTTPKSTWEIDHNLGKFPSVTVVDSAGSVVYGNVDYEDKDHIKVTFNGNFSGHAYLN